MEHEPGCAYWRQRPCNCTYLRSWTPVKQPRLFGPGILLMPAEWMMSEGRNATNGITGRPAEVYTAPGGTVALTPQVRDKIRLSCLSMALEDLPSVVTINYTLTPAERYHREAARRSRPASLIEELNYLRETSRFYRKASLLFGLTALVGIAGNLGGILGWWY
jgi:hypothetical protein